MANLVEILVRMKDDTKAGLDAAKKAAASGGASAGQSFAYKFGEQLQGKLANVGKGLGVGGGIFAGASSLLAMASPLAALTVGIGAFAAVAMPVFSKVQNALSSTGKAGQKAWGQLDPGERQLAGSLKGVESAFGRVEKAMEPTIASVLDMGVKVAGNLLPALSKLATAGAKIIDAFLTPLAKLTSSSTFSQFVSTFAQFGVQAGNLVGPQLVKLIGWMMQLFTQLMPSGMKLLQVLLPLIIQLATDLTPVIVAVATLVADFLQWVQAHHLLLPLLALIAVAVLALGGPVWAIVAAVVALIAIGVELAKNWSKIWADIKGWIADVWNWIKGHWPLLLGILTGPVGAAAAWIATHWSAVSGFFSRALGAIRGIWNGIYSALVSPVIHAYDDIVGWVGNIAGAIGRIPSMINSALGGIPGKVLGFLGFAHGGVVGAAASGGPRSNLVMVGEHGRELVKLPAGSHVMSNPDTERMLGSGGGGGGRLTVYFDFGNGSDELVKVLRKAIRVKGGDVQAVLGH